MSLTIKNVSLRGFVVACRWARIHWGNIQIAALSEEQNNLLQNIAMEHDRREHVKTLK